MSGSHFPAGWPIATDCTESSPAKGLPMPGVGTQLEEKSVYSIMQQNASGARSPHPLAYSAGPGASLETTAKNGSMRSGIMC